MKRPTIPFPASLPITDAALPTALPAALPAVFLAAFLVDEDFVDELLEEDDFLGASFSALADSFALDLLSFAILSSVFELSEVSRYFL